MMYVWIVWGDEPIAVFSSEERARAYVAKYEGGETWSCIAAPVNPEGVTLHGREKVSSLAHLRPVPAVVNMNH